MARPLRRVDELRRGCVGALAALVFASLTGAAPAVGDKPPRESSGPIRPQDELWIVSTRPLRCRTDAALFPVGIRTARYEPSPAGAVWRPTPLDEFTAAIQPSTPTVVFAHGNRVESSEVEGIALGVYRRLRRFACDDRPFRFVTFSWPSGEVKGLIKDVRAKARRTPAASLHMAWLINQTPPDAPIGLLGYSFGARIINGASHLLAGGSLGRLQLADGASLPPRPLRAVYLAPALDNDWLAPGRHHGRAMEQLDQLLITTNRRDPAMRLYARVTRFRDAPALGLEGPRGLRRHTARRVRLINVTEAIGRTHDMRDYLSVRSLVASTWRRLTFADVHAAHAAATPLPNQPTPAENTTNALTASDSAASLPDADTLGLLQRRVD